jgi:hypothetical protein
MEKKRNLWVIPTDKPSRLCINGKNQMHIYITSNEEIKEGVEQWYLDKVLNEPYNSGGAQYSSKQDVIILTTDQDLIKDGIQAIDDIFLEWFVENPSCESVKVESYKIDKEWDEKHTQFNPIYPMKNKYKIIIPNLEVWKDIPDFEGYYQVSNLGNVKSLSRTILGKNDTPTLLKEKMLKFSTSTNGYYQVILCKNSDRKIFKVHSLVAICFLNHIPDGTHNIVVDHINEIKTDNSIENLRLIGHRENVSRSIKDSTSTYVGVSWSKNAKKWISQITIEGKTKYLGLFDNEQDANKKYLETLKDL